MLLHFCLIHTAIHSITNATSCQVCPLLHPLHTTPHPLHLRAVGQLGGLEAEADGGAVGEGGLPDVVVRDEETVVGHLGIADPAGASSGVSPQFIVTRDRLSPECAPILRTERDRLAKGAYQL